MSLWSPTKPLNQPPGYGRVNQPRPVATPDAVKDALRTLRNADNDRSLVHVRRAA